MRGISLLKGGYENMKEARQRYRIICCICAGILLCSSVIPVKVLASSGDKVSIQEFEDMLKTVVKDKTIIKPEEFQDTTKSITRVDAAVLTNRGDELKNGKEYDTKLYAQVKDKKRISGLSKIPLTKVSAVRKCYTKGLMVGDNKGWFTTSREFRGKDYLTKKEAAKIISRLKSKKNRVKLSPDGQVIRTTKLPKNYKKYEYILATLPNGFYEKNFHYKKVNYGQKAVELKDYACPSKIKLMEYNNGYRKYNMGEYCAPNMETWVKKVEHNLYNRFNFNYKNSGTKWLNDLRETYYVYGNENDIGETNSIKNYMKKAKKGKVILKTKKIIVEPSTMYFDATLGVVFRCYVEFKVISSDKIYTAKSGKQHEILYSGLKNVYIEDLSKGKWNTAYFDISIASRAFGSMGQDFAVVDDFLVKE